MHPDAETRILSLALPLEEPNRSAFIKAASEAVEKLGPNAYGPGAIHRRLRRTVQRPVNVRDSDAEHPANLRLALALNPQIANLPLALRVPVKGAQVVHGLGHASAPGILAHKGVHSAVHRLAAPIGTQRSQKATVSFRLGPG